MDNKFIDIRVDSSSLDNLLNYKPKTRATLIKEVRDEILTKSINNTLITEIYKDILKNLIAKFSGLVYRDEQENLKKVPCWHGSTERVISKLKQESNIVLPIVSIYRTNDVLADKRRRNESQLIFDTYFDKVKNRAVRVASIAPAPVDINYRVNIWTKYQEDMDQLSEQLRRYFNPDILVQTKHNTQTVGFLKEESSNVDVTLADGQDRILRRNFEIVIESYISNPKFVITNTGKIETFNAEIYLPLK